MSQISIEVDGVMARVRHLDEIPGKLRHGVERAMNTIGIEMTRYVKTQKLSGQSLNVRSGNLRRAIFYRVGSTSDDSFVFIGADLNKAIYARIQEYGGVIRPKNAAHLTIPIGEALTGNGVARFTARQLIQSPGSYGYVGTFTRNKVIFGRRENKTFEPLFVLKDQVTIKRVGYLNDSMRERKDWMRGVVKLELEKAISGAG